MTALRRTPDRALLSSLSDGRLSQCRSRTRHLRPADFAALQKSLRAFFAGIPHDWRRSNGIQRCEDSQASALFALSSGFGLGPRPEEDSSKGNPDVAAITPDHNVLFEVKVISAFAKLTGPLQTKIGYNPQFMHVTPMRYGPGAPVGILAHEFGHHIGLHSSPQWMNSSRSSGVKADTGAGCALARMVIPTHQLQDSLQAVAAFPSRALPAWTVRLHRFLSTCSACGGT